MQSQLLLLSNYIYIPISTHFRLSYIIFYELFDNIEKVEFLTDNFFGLIGLFNYY